MTSAAQHTPLYQQHLDLNGQIVDFAGWQLPARYQGVMEEHHAVRRQAGLFDVSHMTIVDITGAEAAVLLRKLVANNIDKLTIPGKALYTCMLNEQGGILDDLIVYFFADDDYRIVVNAATRAQDLDWINQQAGSFSVNITERPELALLALQGPQAETHLTQQLAAHADTIQALKPFNTLREGDTIIARTGYTGEDGFEIMLPAAQAVRLWQALIQAGVTPCGLGARDTLRLEAGMCLYGQDMDASVSPLECGLSWTVAWEPDTRDFIGRQALSEQKQQGVKHKLVGLVIDQRTVMRSGYKVFLDDRQVGIVTSGTFSPTIEKPIGMARVSREVQDHCEVEIRGKRYNARVVKPMFVRKGQALDGVA